MVGDYLRMHGFSVSLCDGGASLRKSIAAADAGPDRARSQHAGGGRPLDHPRSQAAHQRADHHAHRHRQRDRPGGRPRARRRRLSGQAVRAARAAGAHPLGAAAEHGRPAAAPAAGPAPSPQRRRPTAPGCGSAPNGSTTTRRRCATTRATSIPLTASEYGLLKVFAANPKRVLSRERLLELANARDAEAFDRAIDLRIMRIRRKIEPDPGPPVGHPHRARRAATCFPRPAKHRRWTDAILPHADETIHAISSTFCVVGASRRNNSPGDETIFPPRRNIEATGVC